MSVASLASHRGSRTIALAVAAGIVAFEIVLGLSAGALGIPGLFLFALRDQTPVLVSGGESSIAKQAAPAMERFRDPPARRGQQFAANDGEPGASPQPVDMAGAASPSSAGTGRDPAAKQAQGSGPTGWKGPDHAPNQTATDAAAGDGKTPKLTGPMNLDVKGAVADLHQSEAEADAKGDTKSADESDSSSAVDAAPPVTNGRPGEVLPWAAAEPDEALLAPLPAPSSKAGAAGGGSAAGRVGSTTAPPSGASGSTGPTVVAAKSDAAPVATAMAVQSSANPEAAATAKPAFPLPAVAQIAQWVKAKATPNAGIDDVGRPLFQFALWLEPPAAMKQHLVAVSYRFDAPSANPDAEQSRDAGSGFRVQFGGLACVDHITLTLTFDDGQTQQIAVNGCQILS